MSQVEDKKSSKKNIFLLLLAGALLLGTFSILGTYKSINCSSLCISGLSSKGNYAIAATIIYAGHKLSDTPVLIVINNMYKSDITTSAESNLQFQAPLKIGINKIEVEYGNSESSVEFFYTGEVLYVLLIPLGAIFFLLIKLHASDSTSRNKVVFYFNDEIVAPIEAETIKCAFDSVAHKSKRAVANLPEKISDISAELSSFYEIEGRKKMQKDSEYLSKKVETLGIAHVLFNCIGQSPLTKPIVGARIFYENAIFSGSPMVLRSRNPKTFIDENKIVFQGDLSIPKLSNLRSKQRKVSLLLFDMEERHILSRSFRTYSKLGAALLMMKLNGTLEVRGQW